MISPLPMEFTRVGDTIVMRLEEYDSVRTIHMNPNAQAPAEHTLFGFSRGRFEGNTLVVETDHIKAGYFDHEGTPMSDADQGRRALHAERRLHAARLHADDDGPRELRAAVRSHALLRVEAREHRAPVRVPRSVLSSAASSR